jgi:SAM-dependent methyltransferase
VNATSSPAAIWQDVECGAYAADLPLWEELADERGGPVLDLGCGTGRVALHLARRGHRVLGLDREPELVAVLTERAAGLPVEVELGDAAGFSLGAGFALALAPMQLLQLLAPDQRAGCLACLASHLRPGGLAALAIVAERAVEHPEREHSGAPPLPDSQEIDGWVYSSLPIESRLDEGGAIVVRRLRQTVSPAGELSEALDEVRLHRLDAAALEREARPAGLRPAGRRELAPTADHVGSTVVLLEAEAA